MTRIVVLNGPNLSRLGTRQPDIYGSQTLSDIEQGMRDRLPPGLTLDFRQSDDEATLIGWLHEAADAGSPVIFNPAAFTHYSYALRDACHIVTEAGVTLMEVHLSNPHARESFRHTSVISGAATGVITGCGADSYYLALSHILTLQERQ
jgi:3-dehydroquinate dehydratase II